MYVGIDLGGTNIAAALVDSDGRIGERTSIRADSSGGAKTIIDGLIEVSEYLLRDTYSTPPAIGIGVPGTVNDEAGEVVFTPNLPLKGVNITRELQERFGCPVRLGNDANCAALGEMIAGGARGAQDIVFITLGTGVGGGLIMGGRLITGLSGGGCEIGHQVILAGGRKCGCGRFGCWESYASATGLVKTAAEYRKTHPYSLLWDNSKGASDRISGKAVFEAYRAGDHAAILAVGQYVEHLSIGLVNLINMLEPELICIGGGVSYAWDCLEEPVQSFIDAERFYRFSPDAPHTRIVRAELGNDAGIIGAALLGCESI